MKNIFTHLAPVLFLFFNVISVHAQAPDFTWAKSAGGSENDFVFGIAAGGGGNTYITGVFAGSAAFGNISLHSNAGAIFIAKYDALGNVLWAKQAGGSFNSRGYGIAVDASENIYVTGSYHGNASFGSTTLPGIGDRDFFIAKYNSSGDLVWVKTGGGLQNDQGHSISLDGNGNAYVTGSFQGNAMFGTTNMTSSGGQDIFVVKYNPSGDVVWVKQMGGSGEDNTQSIAVDNNGNSYLTGYFENTATFGTVTLISNGDKDIFIAKYDEAGNLLWAKNEGGLSQDISNGIAIDASGNSYITGTFYYNTHLSGISFNSIGDQDIFIAKYDDAGTLLWAKQAGGLSRDISYGIAVNGNGNCYITGGFQSVTNFGNFPLTSLGYFNIFVAGFDAAGNNLFAKRAGGSAESIGTTITKNNSGELLVAGYFSVSASLGSTTVNSSGNTDAFITKLSTITGLPESSSTTLTTYPNPFTTSFQLPLTGTQSAFVTLTDVVGRQVHRQVIIPQAETETVTITPPSNLSPGLYLLQVRQGETVRQVQVVRQ